MDIVIVGAGEVGFHLADILARESHRVSVIDSDPGKIRRLRETLDVQALEGDGTQASVLASAGASTADLFIAVTDNDHINMVASPLARRMGSKRVILRLKDTWRLQGYSFFYKQALGFDVALSTDELSAQEIIRTVREQHALEVESFADGRVQLRRVRISESGELTSAALSKLDLPDNVVVAAIARKKSFFAAHGDDRLEKGDQVYLIGRSAALDQFEFLTGARRLGRRSVVIMGGGRVGSQLAMRLSELPGLSIRILERDPDRARTIAARFPENVMVLVGDATDTDLLREERFDKVNVFIGATADDEDNLIACQLAKSYGAERTVALLDKPSYRDIYDVMGVDFAISPRILCANRILRFVRSEAVMSIAVVAEGRGEVIEIEARLPGGKSDVKLKHLGLPKGVVVGAVVHGDDVTIPRGETTIRNGDRLIVFSLAESVEELSEFFGVSDGYALD
ncbi:Trk system potassium transporter TrkA [Engelhardtia mirabilis]|uniref:Trk system potassium uptake protein TrkA n=1 Tax=Engelhardtia mirabilis TaxID=2528011 RepID=A0A518BMB6_9BACT|nr:Trk system potassium uptake protein TrkA [Planctomycetes bacterium Pla133]QDV02413.1 Trk system potassium uptake protein TrkA [Planctomycetes bacterium Pla86]